MVTTIVFVIIGVIFVGAYAAWRYKKATAAQERFASLIPLRTARVGNVSNRLQLKRAENSALTVTDEGSPVVGDSELTVAVGPALKIGTFDVGFLRDLSIVAAAADGAIAGSFIADAALKITRKYFTR